MKKVKKSNFERIGNYMVGPIPGDNDNLTLHVNLIYDLEDKGIWGRIRKINWDKLFRDIVDLQETQNGAFIRDVRRSVPFKSGSSFKCVNFPEDMIADVLREDKEDKLRITGFEVRFN